MTFADHTKVTISGGLPGGEQWACTFALAQFDAPAPNVDAIAATAIAAGTTLFRNVESFVSGETSLQRAVARTYRGGVVVDAGEAAPEGVVLGIGNTNLPNSVCVVMTLNTTTPGAKGRGRLFLPLLAMGMGTDGRLGSGQITPCLPLWRTFLKAVVDSAGGGAPAAQASLVVASQLGQGANYPVISLRMGNVTDTQRRRAKSVPETRISLPFP